MVDNCIEDWRIALSARRLLQLALELAVCSLHPPPGAFYFRWRPVYHDAHGAAAADDDDDDDGAAGASRLVPIDALLVLPMFFRLYLVCRQLYSVYCNDQWLNWGGGDPGGSPLPHL